MEENEFYQDLQEKLNYQFIEKSLLLDAFTHSSYSNEHKGCASYERLEFLGDATVGFVVGEYLYKTYPTSDEGRLTALRAGIVSENTLSKAVDKLGITNYLRTGAGDANGQLFNSSRIKCNLFEAVVGAILLDCKGDIYQAKKFVLTNLKPFLTSDNTDYKSLLLEICAKNDKKAEFATESISISPQEPLFKSVLYINGKSVAEGKGKNKKQAEKTASKNFLDSQ